MKKIIKFGEDVQGYEIPVLNEREIRAAAGMLFLLMIISLFMILSKGNFLLIKYSISLFLTDFIIRVFVSPRFSPTLILARMIVSNQTPEYVGAKQKMFSWIIGLVLATTMFILMVIVNSYSPISGIICLICLIFLFFESVFGICLGCKVYSLIYKEKAQYCPGEVCDVKSKQEIQKISKAQLFVVLGFVAYIFLMSYFLNTSFSVKPHDLFATESPAK